MTVLACPTTARATGCVSARAVLLYIVLEAAAAADALLALESLVSSDAAPSPSSSWTRTCSHTLTRAKGTATARAMLCMCRCQCVVRHTSPGASLMNLNAKSIALRCVLKVLIMLSMEVSALSTPSR